MLFAALIAGSLGAKTALRALCPAMTNRRVFSRPDARPRHAVQPHDPEKWLPVFGQDHAQETVNDSAEHHRVTPEPAVGPAFGSIVLCEHLPGFHFADRGYKAKK
jgi:hypothetical protein